MTFGHMVDRLVTVIEGDYWNDDKIWSGDTYVGDNKPLRLPELDDLSEIPAITVVTVVSREELELITTLREYNETIDASVKADAVRDEAENAAEDARWERNDARMDFTNALDAVKHDGDHRSYDSYFGN